MAAAFCTMCDAADDDRGRAVRHPRKRRIPGFPPPGWFPPRPDGYRGGHHRSCHRGFGVVRTGLLRRAGAITVSAAIVSATAITATVSAITAATRGRTATASLVLSALIGSGIATTLAATAITPAMSAAMAAVAAAVAIQLRRLQQRIEAWNRVSPSLRLDEASDPRTATAGLGFSQSEHLMLCRCGAISRRNFFVYPDGVRLPI